MLYVNSVYNLANAYVQLRHFKEALQYFREFFKSIQQLNTPETREAGFALYYSAYASMKLKDYEQAFVTFKDAAVVLERQGSAEHIRFSLYYAGKLAVKLARFEEAQKLLTDAKELHYNTQGRSPARKKGSKVSKINKLLKLCRKHLLII